MQPNANRKMKNKPPTISDEVQIGIGDVIYGNELNVYIIAEYLGYGQYGKVFKVVEKDRLRAEPLACKIQSIKFKKEPKIHRLLSHKHIVKLLSSYCSTRYCFIFMEYCKNGTLHNLVRQRNGLTILESRYFFYQINLGVKYMHKMKIIHRDLKMDNIFLAKNMQIKIGDFGLAIPMNATQTKRTKNEQNRNVYKAPELFQGEDYSAASDTWAVGV